MSSPALEVRRAADRFRTQTDWVDSRHLFSFGEHYDPANVGFGALLVCNDDLLSPGPGYDDHPHANAEIVTWVLSGSLVHEDSAGHRGVLGRGMAQRMSAGSGIVHAERNDAYRLDPGRPAEPVRFVQMWLRPDVPDTPPSYAQRELALPDLDRGWLPVASGSHPDAVVDVQVAGATLWATRLAPDDRRVLPESALTHLYVVDGEVEVETAGVLGTGDSLRVHDPGALRVTGRRDAELLVWSFAR